MVNQQQKTQDMLVSVNSVTTDHLIFRGYYYVLTMCIYGEILEDPQRIAMDTPLFNMPVGVNQLDHDLKVMKARQMQCQRKLQVVP